VVAVVLLGWAGAQELFHTVQQGETLFSIARRYGTTVETLMRINGLDRPNLEVGQVLRLPPPTPSPQSSPTTTYTVQPGDTLFGLARRFGVTVEALKSENGLAGAALSVGQVLKVPAAADAQPSSPTETALTVVAQPAYEIGFLACETLVSLLQQKKQLHSHILRLKTRLLIRQSTARPYEGD